MRRQRAHLLALAAPWWQRRNEGTLWMVAALALIAQIPGIVIAWTRPAATAGALSFGVALLLQGLWLMQFASLRQQNHPNAARLVPGHTRTLRESMVGLWLLIMAVTALLPGSGPGWALLAGLMMLTTALLTRMPWLWLPLSFAPLLFGLTARQPEWRGLIEWWLDPAAGSRWAWYAAAVLLLASLLCLLLQDGGTAHIRSYAYGIKLRRSLHQRGGNWRLPPFTGRLGEAVGWLFQTPFRAWMRHLVARATPAEHSMMARADLALGSHWTGQLTGGLVFVTIFVLSGTVAWFGFHFPLWEFRGQASVGLMIGAISAGMAPVMALRASLHNTRREQALLLMLPGMPRGTALNKALARRQLYRVLLSWCLAMAFILLLSAGTAILWPCVAFGLACLPTALLLWRDWSRVPPPSASAQTMPVLLMTGMGLATMALFQRLQLSPLWLLPLAAAIVALGVWRWLRISSFPQAFPAGRLAP